MTPDERADNPLSRREWLARGGRSALAATLAGAAPVLAASGRAALPDEGSDESDETAPSGRADHCVVLWLGGGACQIDTFDPKRRGDAKRKIPGSYYDAIPTAVPGVSVSEHLPRTAQRLDRTVLVRTVHHEVIDEHAAAVNRMHTGRPTSGTVVYPSMGSVVAHQRGAATDGVPPYVVMGYPNLTRGPGFLGAKHGYIYLTDTTSGPAGLSRPPSVNEARYRRRLRLLESLRAAGTPDAGAKDPRDPVEEYAAAADQAYRLTGPEFMSAFELDSEPRTLRESYGSEFGQRCLLARRLIERGVRFIEVAHNLNFLNGTGWDTHNDGQVRQHELIRELDGAFASLLDDLEKRGLLERTLVMISTEFGRPAAFDGGGGRGHQSRAFSVVLAGAGLRGGTVIGETDELGERASSDPVSVPDLFATAYTALGVDPAQELYAGERPVPITDRGRPIRRAFA